MKNYLIKLLGGYTEDEYENKIYDEVVESMQTFCEDNQAMVTFLDGDKEKTLYPTTQRVH